MLKIFFNTLQLIVIAAWMLLCYAICESAGGFQFLGYWVLIGFPFGFRKLSLYLAPKGLGIGGDLAVFALDAMVAGFIGGFFLVRKLIKILADYVEGIIGFVKWIRR